MRRSILKNSLKMLYADSPEILEMFELIRFEELDYKFYKELFHHIDEKLFYEVDNYLNGEDVKLYQYAVDRAAMSVTRELSDLIELAFTSKDTKH